MPLKQIVDFFIVGAPKCGTTMLFQYLNSNANCFLPEKEMHYFNTDIPTKSHESIDCYLQKFSDAPSGALSGDASVWYLYSRDAIPGIRAFNPSARIIAMLRNPVHATDALHGQLRLVGRETIRSLEKAWGACDERRAMNGSPANAQLQYDAVYRYAPQLERLYRCFPPEQVKIVVLEEFRKDPGRIFSEIVEFVGANGSVPGKFDRVNASKRIRSTILQKAVFSAPQRLGPAYGLTKTLFNALGLRPGKYFLNLHHNWNVASGPRRAVSESVQRAMAQFFLPDIARVEEILGRRMIAWREDLEKKV